MEKPSDFFVGVLDLFGILLPGAVATALLAPRLEDRVFAALGARPSGDVAEGATFLLVAYFLGHLVFHIGSWLDPLYDWCRKRFDPYDDKSPYRFAEALRNGALTDKEQAAINPFQWARSVLLAKCPAAAQDIHRLEADSKFFRSLFVVSIFAALGFLGNCDPTDGLLAFLLAVLCFALYYQRRQKSTKQAYIHVVALHRAGCLGGAGKPAGEA